MFYELNLKPCTCGVLKTLLNPDAGEYIWINSHIPEPMLRWWEADIPVAPGAMLKQVKVRRITYDLQLTTADFLATLDRFEGCGMYLVQFDRPVPDTLEIDRVPAGRIDEILIANGAQSTFYLPHPKEVAVYKTVDQKWLDHLKRGSFFF